MGPVALSGALTSSVVIVRDSWVLCLYRTKVLSKAFIRRHGYKILASQTGELAQPLRAIAGYREDPVFDSQHPWQKAHKHLNLHFQEIQCLFWPP